MRKERRFDVKYKRKEKGLFGIDAVVLVIMFILALVLVYMVNRTIVGMGWRGFITYMQPDYAYPSFEGGMSGNMGHNVLIAAVFIQQNIVMRYIVNSLFLIILLIAGLSYIYSDLFEQFMGKLKTLLPRIIFGLILAYTSLYIIQALMVIAKGAYILFYNIPQFSAWKSEDYIFRIAPDIRVVSQGSIWEFLNQLAEMYWRYLWVFVIMAEVLSLLIFVAFRLVLLAILIVLLPIASILLIHPWTQQIGSRLWWLAIALVFIPIVMIIPLMLSTVVGNSVSFFIACLASVLGSIYLLAKEPFILSGLGFQRAGAVLRGGIIGGGVSGNLLAPTRIGAGVGEYTMVTLRGGMVRGLAGGIEEKIARLFRHNIVVPTVGGAGANQNNFTEWADSRGGVR